MHAIFPSGKKIVNSPSSCKHKSRPCVEKMRGNEAFREGWFGSSFDGPIGSIGSRSSWKCEVMANVPMEVSERQKKRTIVYKAQVAGVNFHSRAYPFHENLLWAFPIYTSRSVAFPTHCARTVQLKEERRKNTEPSSGRACLCCWQMRKKFDSKAWILTLIIFN